MQIWIRNVLWQANKITIYAEPFILLYREKKVDEKLLLIVATTFAWQQKIDQIQEGSHFQDV